MKDDSKELAALREAYEAWELDLTAADRVIEAAGRLIAALDARQVKKNRPVYRRPRHAPFTMLGQRLQALRKEKGWTLADVEGYTQSAVRVGTLSCIEQGKTVKPYPKTILALARLYGVPKDRIEVWASQSIRQKERLALAKNG